MIGTKRTRNEKKDKIKQKNDSQIINKEKDNNINQKSSKIIKTNTKNENEETKIYLNKNDYVIHNFNKLINDNNDKNDNKEINTKNKNIFPNFENSSKLNFDQVKQKFKQLDNSYDENNIIILNNIDRLTSILSSIIIAQNEQKANEKNEKENNKKDIQLNNNDDDGNKINEDIKPLIIDANNDQYLNYLLSLNDSLKKKINNAIKFDEIDNFFTNFVFEQIQTFMTNLRKSK